MGSVPRLRENDSFLSGVSRYGSTGSPRGRFSAPRSLGGAFAGDPHPLGLLSALPHHARILDRHSGGGCLSLGRGWTPSSSSSSSWPREGVGIEDCEEEECSCVSFCNGKNLQEETRMGWRASKTTTSRRRRKPPYDRTQDYETVTKFNTRSYFFHTFFFSLRQWFRRGRFKNLFSIFFTFFLFFQTAFTESAEIRTATLPCWTTFLLHTHIDGPSKSRVTARISAQFGSVEFADSTSRNASLLSYIRELQYEGVDGDARQGWEVEGERSEVNAMLGNLTYERCGALYTGYDAVYVKFGARGRLDQQVVLSVGMAPQPEKWRKMLQVTGMEPKVGPWSGGTNVTFKMNTSSFHLENGGKGAWNYHFRCVWGDASHRDLTSVATRIDDNRIWCLSPPLPSEWWRAGGANTLMVSLRYYLYPYDFFQTAMQPFSIHRPIEVASAYPQFG